ncbi:MAG: hypothetical protein M1281_08800 [Chloroflexi bacterium]|nr:hypothetical protein [Chloroflexota bacterium]
MPKPLRISAFIAVALLGITACAQGIATPIPAPTASPSSPAVRPTATLAASSTGQPSATLPAAAGTATSVVEGPGCTVSASLIPTPGPTEAALFPAPTEADWIEGPATASITFLEYSDFQ